MSEPRIPVGKARFATLEPIDALTKLLLSDTYESKIKKDGKAENIHLFAKEDEEQDEEVVKLRRSLQLEDPDRELSSYSAQRSC